MRRRQLLAVLAAAAALPLRAQVRTRPFRIGLLWITSEEAAAYTHALTDGLRTLGYARGKDYVLEDSFLVRNYEGLEEAARKLVAANVDLILTLGATASQTAVRLTTRIPIVFITASDPVALKLVPNLARPGGNATGVTVSSDDLNGKRMELLKSALPKVKRVAVLHYPGSAAEVAALKAYTDFGRALGFDVRPMPVREISEIESAVAALPPNVDALMVVGSTLFLGHRKAIVASVNKRGIPAMYSQPYYVDDGGLFSYGSTSIQLFGLSASYIDKIMKGVKPGDIPVEQQSRFELLINMRTAKAQGVEFPASLLTRADRVVE